MTGKRSISPVVDHQPTGGETFHGACLQIVGSGSSFRDVRLPAKRLIIGRDRNQCDIVCEGDTISRKHASIQPYGRNKFQLTDLDSTNGVYVNNKRIKSNYRLSHNDVIGLGRSGTAHLHFFKLPFNRLSNADLLPPQNTWTIGRSPDCDICLPFVSIVSAHHATISATSGQLLLVDESSLNGTWKNGRSIRRDQVNPEDSIVIGSEEFRFQLLDNGALQVIRRRRNGNLRLQCKGVTCSLGKGENRPLLLNNIDLSLNPGEFVGILGPSGAGKTTLLKTLSGHIPPDSGTILLNNIPLYATYEMFRSRMGYVPQDDILHSALSVKNSLDYIARLRLPHDVEDTERLEIVDSILNILDLGRVRENRIDQLSGGQRKRVSIGAELITGPALLFLDEPTSGLDPGIGERLMRHFRAMTENNTTVVITTHTLDNLDVFDKIVFLARGELVFFGTPDEALTFFRQFNASISRPVDIFHLLDLGPDKTRATKQPKALTDRRAIAAHLAGQYKSSVYCRRNIGISTPLSIQDPQVTRQSFQPDKSTGFSAISGYFALKTKTLKKKIQPDFSFADWLTLSRRHISIRLASPKRILSYIVIPILLALVTLTQNILGFPNEETTTLRRQTTQLQVRSGGPVMEASLKTMLSPKGMDDPRQAWEILHAVRYQGPANLPIPIGVLLMAIMTAGFLGTVAGCHEISSERLIYSRERMSGMRIFDYLGSKLPFCFSITAIQCLVYISCFYLHPSLRTLTFIPIWLTMTAVAWTSVTMGLFISAIDPTSGRLSVLLAVSAVLPQLILSGGLGPDFFSGMDAVTRWTASFMPARWGFEMGLTAVYSGQHETVIPWVPEFIRQVIGFDYGSRVYYDGVRMLAVQSVVWLLLCAWLLRRRDPI